MRIWKRLVSLFLALCLWTVSPLALASSVGVIGGAESATSLTVGASEVTNEIQLENCFFDALCTLGDRIYASDYTNLYELSPDAPGKINAVYPFELETTTFTSGNESYEMADPVLWLASDGESLYGFSQSRQLRKLTIEGNAVKLGETIAQLENDDPDSWVDIGGMVIQEGAAYVLVSVSGDSWGKYDLWEIQLSDGAVRQVTTGAVLSICSYKPGTLLVRYWDQETAYSGTEVIMPTLCSLDTATGALTELLTLPDTQQCGVAYDPATDTIYTATDSLLYRRVALGEPEPCAYLNLRYLSTNTSSAVLNGKYYVVNNSDGGYLVSETDPAKMPERALRISTYYKDDTISAFMKAHPEIPVVTQQTDAYTAEQIAQNMVAGTEASDIYIVTIDGGSFEQLRDKGYCVDMSTSEILMEQVARMNPRFTSAFFQDGKLWAFPSSAYASGFGYSPSVLEKIGMSEDELPKTLLEYMDFAVNWLDNYAYDYADLMLLDNVYDIRSQLFSQVLISYVSYYAATNQALDFDTPLMHKLLAKLDEVAPILEELNPEENSSGSVVFYSSDDTPTALLTEYMNYTPQEYSFNWDYQPLLLSLDEGMDPVIPMSMEVYLINPNSENADMAITFLEFVAQHMKDSMEITLCPDANDPVEDPDALRSIGEMQKSMEDLQAKLETADESEKRDLEDTIEMYQQSLVSMEDHKYIISSDDIAMYREVEPYIYVSTSSIYANITTDGGQLLQRYMDGQMSSEQFIKDFNRIIRMMQMEDM